MSEGWWETGKHDPLCPILDPPPYTISVSCGCSLIARTREAIAVQIEAQHWPGHSPSCNCERCRDRAASASIARGAR